MSSQLRAAIVREFREVARIASEAGTNTDPIDSVQTARRTLRRARSLWAMLDTRLPKRAHKEGLDALREARRGLSWSRGDARAPRLLASLHLDPAAQETAAKIIANASELVPKFSEVAPLLAYAGQVVTKEADSLEATIEDLSWDDVVAGIAEQYDWARDRRKEAKESRSAFHAYRRRLRELSHQLGFVDATAGTRSLAPFEDALAAASAAVDLIVLRDFVKASSHGIDGDAVKALLHAIDAPFKDLRKTALDLGGEALSDKPKKFAKNLRESLRGGEA